MASINYMHVTCISGMTQHISQTWKSKFDTDDISIIIDNWFSLTMHHIMQDFVGPLKKVQRINNVFKVPKVYTIYEDTISWTIDDDKVHPHWVEILNYVCVPNGCERIISPQHWIHNATSDHADSTALYVTWCVTHHYCATLICSGGCFFHNVTLDNYNVFTIHTAPRYTSFTDYCNAVGYDPYFHIDQPWCVPDNVDVFSKTSVTHKVSQIMYSSLLLPLRPYTPPEGKTLPSEVVSQDS